MKTYTLRAGEVETRWHVLDAEGRPLGRLASEAAQLLRGKYRPTFTPHMDNGDFVIVVNARKVKVTGNKTMQKVYYRHSGYPGGLKETLLARMLEKHPERVVQAAVKGMLPHNRLSRRLLRHLKVYGGPDHPHEAQVNAGVRRSKAEAAPAPKAEAAPEPEEPEDEAAAPEVDAAESPAAEAPPDENEGDEEQA
jgi:large subunit ribosomal protein L13